jgi:hypothetical protein
MVMDAGRLAELDTPDTLIATKGGIFSGLWESFQREHGETSKAGDKKSENEK